MSLAECISLEGQTMTAHIRTKRSRKRKPGQGKLAVSQVTLPAWDQGAMGPANRPGLVEEDAPTIDPDTGEEFNPNGVRRMRRVDLLDVWHRKGVLSAAAYSVACDLRDAFLATQMGRAVDLTQERVDSSPKPDHAVTIQIDRLSKFHALMRHVVRADVPIIQACVLDGGGPGDVVGRDGLHPFRNVVGEIWRHDAGLRALSDALERLAKGRA
jgi:hypothetical protein